MSVRGNVGHGCIVKFLGGLCFWCAQQRLWNRAKLCSHSSSAAILTWRTLLTETWIALWLHCIICSAVLCWSCLCSARAALLLTLQLLMPPHYTVIGQVCKRCLRVCIICVCTVHLTPPHSRFISSFPSSFVFKKRLLLPVAGKHIQTSLIEAYPEPLQPVIGLSPSPSATWRLWLYVVL